MCKSSVLGPHKDQTAEMVLILHKRSLDQFKMNFIFEFQLVLSEKCIAQLVTKGVLSLLVQLY